MPLVCQIILVWQWHSFQNSLSSHSDQLFNFFCRAEHFYVVQDYYQNAVFLSTSASQCCTVGGVNTAEAHNQISTGNISAATLDTLLPIKLQCILPVCQIIPGDSDILSKNSLSAHFNQLFNFIRTSEYFYVAVDNFQRLVFLFISASLSSVY